MYNITNPTSQRLEIQIGPCQAIGCFVSPFSCHWFVILWFAFMLHWLKWEENFIENSTSSVFSGGPRSLMESKENDNNKTNIKSKISIRNLNILTSLFIYFHLFSSIFPTFLQLLITRFHRQSQNKLQHKWTIYHK